MRWIRHWLMRRRNKTKQGRRCAKSRYCRPTVQLKVESCEPRCLLSVTPLVLGVVYTETDEGTDTTGDFFEVSFVGGAPGTELRELVIDGDKTSVFGNLPGISAGDVFFDTIEDATSLGADHAFPFTIIAIADASGRPKHDVQVRAFVEDGSTRLTLVLNNFLAGDKLTFAIDVDEVEMFEPSESNMSDINSGIDPITSGIEMQGTVVVGRFSAPHYHDATVESSFINQYDTRRDQLLGDLAIPGLNLPLDNERQNRDRTAGAFGRREQQPLPIVVRGRVYHDRNVNLAFDPSAGDHGIAGVQLSLFSQRDDGTYQPVMRQGRPVQTVTDADGFYEFGIQWNLVPGVYQVREVQPTTFPISVAAMVGTVDGQRVGRAESPDILTDIHIVTGGVVAEGYDFAEALPTRLTGGVFYDANDDGSRDPNELGIPGVVVRLQDATGHVLAAAATDAAGRFTFDGLRPGIYQLVEEQPDGWIDGKDSVGTVNGNARGVVGNDRFPAIELLSGDGGVDYLFGERLGMISGRVHMDQDGNCHFDAQELPLEGVTILLVDEHGRQRTTVTDAQGKYVFSQLGPGAYSIIQLQPTGYFNGSQSIGSGGGDVTQVNVISQVVVNEQQPILDGYDFCETLGTISGFVYHDRNDNATRDELQEEGIPGVLVQLWNDNQFWAVAITDESGYYEFKHLPPGVYRLEQLQPIGWLDGQDSVGFVRTSDGQVRRSGELVGNDQIDHIHLVQEPDAFGSVHGEHYNFGEWLAASLSGTVFVDLNNNGILEPDRIIPHSTQRERPLADVVITLKDQAGRLIAETVTDASGTYRFEALRPGVYQIEQQQPVGFFDGGVRVGSHGGVGQPNRVGNIVLDSGQVAVDYDFYEHPPATISGWVFQDGPAIVVTQFLGPEQLITIRDGQLSPDDTPISGVWLELRSGFDGRPIDASEALPGDYPSGPIRVQTDAHGRYVFQGLPRGNYAVYQIQPEGYVDSIDTPGTTSGVALNALEPQPLGLLSRFSGNPPPPNDAILAIAVGFGQNSEQNNFSEVLIVGIPKVEDPPGRPPPQTPAVVAIVPTAPTRFLPLPPAATRTSIPIYGASGHVDATWHLSIIDAGFPRGDVSPLELSDRYAWITHVDTRRTWLQALDRGKWKLLDRTRQKEFSELHFGLPGAIPLAGDFSGDRRAEIALYANGQWFVDLNGNGRWDPEDLWLALGTEHDLPVVGDWDGDGKGDVGIFGPMWVEDPRAVMAEPGLPDVENPPTPKPKNPPPSREEATNGLRVLQRGAVAAPRAHLIDHVFRFGALGDLPVTGDWNGDGITNVGLFRHGTWILDTNGNGRLDAGDSRFQFGQTGDRPLVGDFDGKGSSQIAIYRDDQIIIDSNRNRRLDEADQVLPMHGRGIPVAGDFDGDGRDEIMLYEPGDTGESAHDGSVQ